MRATSKWALIAGLSLAICSVASAWASEPSALPSLKVQHLGVSTCAGSNCHGAIRPVSGSNIRQDEYFLWQRSDPHSRAWKALVSPAGKRIAANLGIKDAGSAAECLSCHTDYVPQEQRGQKFDITEGVTCEACHGGAKTWLGPHVSGNTHAQNLEAGLYPLENPVARAQLCLGCHLGNAEKPITHRMMGAGHPALKFELDTYSNTQSSPPHFTIDKDYRQRKSYTSNAKMWVVGQLTASDFFVDGLISNRFVDRGMFPELVFFECDACHHPIQKLRWNPGASGSLGPGQPRLADANLVMTGVLLNVLSPESSKDWKTALAQLHAGSVESVAKVREAAKSLKTTTRAITQKLSGKEISRSDALNTMKALADLGIEQRHGDLTGTTQVYFAMDALFAYLSKDHNVPRNALQTEMDEIFNAINSPINYDPLAAKAALIKARSAMEKVQP